MMKPCLAIFVFAFSTFCFAGGLPSGEQREVKISGEYVYYINVAFDEYVKGQSYRSDRIYGDISYHVFSVRESDAYVIVGIGYDQKRLLKENNVIIFGGGAEFYIGKTSRKIEKKLFFK